MRGQLVSVAIGDAWGSGYEFCERDWIERHPPSLRRHIKHPVFDIGGGRYSDDTQMSLAIARAMLDEKAGERWEPKLLARRFVEAFKADPRAGYAGGFYDFLKSVQDGDEFLARIRPNSTKAGAAMRATPLGAYEDEFEVIERAGVQAGVTHNTPEGIVSAQAAALSAHYFFWGKGPQAELGAYLNDFLGAQEFDWEAPRREGPITGEGYSCVSAAVSALKAAEGLESMCEGLILLGGDVDTACAIACGAGAFCDQMDLSWSDALVEGLERGPFGMERLEAMDSALRKAYPLPSRSRAPGGSGPRGLGG